MDYVPVERLYVVDGYVSDSGIEVTVSTTRNMEDGNRDTSVSDAVVEISGSDGFRETLRYETDGHYRSPSGAAGTPGNTYTLTVITADGKEFVATSEMTAPGQLSSVKFGYEPSITIRYMFCSVNILDPAGTENRYCLRIFKNGNPYSRNLITDKGHEGSIIPNTLLVRFSWNENPTPEEIARGGTDIFRKGDLLYMVLETIDRPVYDYIYSLGLGGGSLSNPLTNIEGGCLGYFRAYSSAAWQTVFDPEAIIGPDGHDSQTSGL